MITYFQRFTVAMSLMLCVREWITRPWRVYDTRSSPNFLGANIDWMHGLLLFDMSQLQVYLILDEFLMGGEIQETSKKVKFDLSISSHWHTWSLISLCRRPMVLRFLKIACKEETHSINLCSQFARYYYSIRPRIDAEFGLCKKTQCLNAVHHAIWICLSYLNPQVSQACIVSQGL